MTQREQRSPNPDAVRKDPDDWVSGGEPWTAAQRSYLGTLAREAGEQLPESMSKADAARRIEQLQERTGRGAGSSQ